MIKIVFNLIRVNVKGVCYLFNLSDFIGAPEIEGTEPAPRTWRGAGAAPSRSHGGAELQGPSITSRAMTLLAIVAIVYCVTAAWKRCGRKLRRRRLMSLAT